MDHARPTLASYTRLALRPGPGAGQALVQKRQGPVPALLTRRPLKDAPLGPSDHPTSFLRSPAASSQH